MNKKSIDYIQEYNHAKHLSLVQYCTLVEHSIRFVHTQRNILIMISRFCVSANFILARRLGVNYYYITITRIEITNEHKSNIIVIEACINTTNDTVN